MIARFVVPLAALAVPASVIAGLLVVSVWARGTGARQVRHRLGGRPGPGPVSRTAAPDRGPHPGWAPGWFRRRLDAMAVTADPVRLWRWGGLGLLGAVLVSLVLGGPALAALVVLASTGSAAVAAELNQDRADRLVDAALPALLDRLAAGLRAGLSLPGALREGVPVEAGPLRRDLLFVVAAMEAGVPLAQCLGRWRARRPTRGTRLVTAALALCWLLGGRSRPLEGVASTLRDHLAVEREVRAVCAQARASAVVLVVTPWVFLAFMAAQDPGLIGFFLGSLVGLSCLAGGLALDLGGAWLMSRTIRSVR